MTRRTMQVSDQWRRTSRAFAVAIVVASGVSTQGLAQVPENTAPTARPRSTAVVPVEAGQLPAPQAIGQPSPSGMGQDRFPMLAIPPSGSVTGNHLTEGGGAPTALAPLHSIVGD